MSAPYRELLAYADKLKIPVISWDYCKCSTSLGAGTAMSVYSGTCEIKGVTKHAAFKTIKNNLTERTTSRKRGSILMDIKQEIHIMGCLKGHSRIIQLLAISFNDYTPILILELASCTLEEYLQIDKPVEWKVKLSFMYDIALGVEAIHKAKAVYGNLKADNILIFSNYHDQMVAKVSDFVYSATNFDVQEGRRPGFSFNFCSPETFDNELMKWDGAPTIDIYSYGLVVYQIVNDGAIPFVDFENDEIDIIKMAGNELKVLLRKLPDNTPEEVRIVITKTVRRIPSERSSLEEVKNILKRSKEWNQSYSHEDIEIASETLDQTVSQDSIKISKMNKLPIPPSLKKIIFNDYQRFGDHKSIYNTGMCWYYGFGTEKDYIKAFKCFQDAANLGNINAQCSLGVCYENGHGITEDLTKAAEWYQKAANAGDADAQYRLALFYQNGNGVLKDHKKAIQLLEMAANADDANAQYNLGFCYKHGLGVAKDDIKVVEWYTKAANAGHAMALYHLGSCYKNGYGVAMDIGLANEFYMKAEEIGFLEFSSESSSNGLICSASIALGPLPSGWETRTTLESKRTLVVRI